MFFKRMLLLGIGTSWLLAQSPQVVLLEIDVENVVTYRDAVADASKRAADPGPTTTPTPKAFTDFLTVGDIVAINGQPAKGTWTSRGMTLGLSPTAGIGFAVADVTQGSIADCKWEIEQADGTFVGRLNDGGLFPHTIMGGVGAYFGVTGEQRTGTPPVSKPARNAAMTEDPSMRRILGGGTARHEMYLLPLLRPKIEALMHNDLSPVTASKPAHAGEWLIVRARGLGPTKPNLDPPGHQFPPGQPYEQINSPIDVTVGGRVAVTFNKIGWPGEIDVYRVDFLVPDGTPPGQAAVQMLAAWIPGDVVNVPVQ